MVDRERGAELKKGVLRAIEQVRIEKENLSLSVVILHGPFIGK
jgi:hypothetical protein